jgi:predicted phage-related endonuclease
MVAQSDEHDWMIASLDGFDVGAQSILEIKCPMSSEKILSNIPLHYRYQMQHQMAVCGVDQCLLAVLVNEHTMDFSLHTEHRNELIIKEILEKGKAFHESLLRWESPEDCAEQRDDLKPLMDDLFEHRKQMKLMEMQDKEKLDIIKCMADGKSIYSGERKLTKYASKGAIDYSSIPQLNGVDLEPYRKSGKEAWRFS